MIDRRAPAPAVPAFPGARGAGRLASTLIALASLVVLVALSACTAPITTAPTGSPQPSTAPSTGPVTSPAAAAAAVIATDPRFAGLKAQDPNLIGACCSFTAAEAGDGYAVVIEIGWGDCPAGCIDRHHWFYTVSRDGAVRLDREDGPALPAGVPGSAGGTTGGTTDGGGGAALVGIRGSATAGPVCPVSRPNDPACADRPVAGTTIHVLDHTGLEVATLVTDATGAFQASLPPGDYRLLAEPVVGLMGTPAQTDVTVSATLAVVQLVYDTGIR